MKKSKFKPGKLVVAMACVSLVVITSDCVRRVLDNTDLDSIVDNQGDFVNGRPPQTPISRVPEETTEPLESSRAVTKEDINRGLLVPANDKNPILPETDKTMVDLVTYKNEFYSVHCESAMLSTEAADAFNRMMQGYTNATSLSDFIVYGTTSCYNGSDSPCPKAFADCASGYTVDVAVEGYGVILPYDGLDTEKWVVDNCANYGFIVRYPEGRESVTNESYCPWHLRYVGQPHALVMKANNMCLEDYVKYVQQYTADKPIKSNVGADIYEIYSVPSIGDVTYIDISAGGKYEISGDGELGYIVTVKK